MFKYAALVSYRGTRYCGWQKQKGSAAEGEPSIQETIEKALTRITGEEASAVGSGRTDSGVHAAGQVVHFVLKKKRWDCGILRKGLNSQLHRSIRVLALQEAPIEFHSQRSAEKKQYSYYFQQGPCEAPQIEPFSWWISRKLDLEAMDQAVKHLVGRHDFKPFQASGSKPGPTVREILEAEVTREPILFPGSAIWPGVGCHLVRVRVVGTGFLKQMVRGIAGTLLQVGDGRRGPECMREILESMDRSKVGPTAPARALWLERVWYKELTFFGSND
jgi:tRNA pseudouridine38-40 synthase